MTDFSKERRKYSRYLNQFQVELSKFVFPLEVQERVATKCINVSAGGLLLQTDFPFTQGDKVQVRLHVPRLNKYHPGFFKVFESVSDQTLLAISTIVRVRPLSGEGYEVALKFLDVYEDDWLALYHLLQKEGRL